MLKPTFTQRFGPCPEGARVVELYPFDGYGIDTPEFTYTGFTTLDEAENALSFWKAGW